MNDVTSKAKAIGATVHEYFLAAISVAINKVTDGKEVTKVNFVMPISIGESEENLKNFLPGNYTCATFSSIAPKSSLSEASKAASESMARYRDPNYITFWIWC